MSWWMAGAAAVSLAGAAMSGQAGVGAAKANRAEMYRRASTTKAISQRDAWEIGQAGEVTLSRLRAVAAGGQGSRADYGNPVIEESRIVGQTIYNQMSALWSGDDKARQMIRTGEIAVDEAKAERTAGYISSIGSSMSAFGASGGFKAKPTTTVPAGNWSTTGPGAFTKGGMRVR